MKTKLISTLSAAVLMAGLGTSASPALANGPAADPEAGVSCPAGYAGQLTGNTFRCVKQVTLDMSNTQSRECSQDAPFTNFQRMNGNQRDICVHQDSNIPSNANLAEFDNGKVLISIPNGVALPRNLANRTPVRVVGNLRFFQINPNADFIFYDGSKTLQSLTTVEVARTRLRERIALSRAGESTPVGANLERISTAQIDASGPLDRVEARVRLTALPN